MGFNPVVAYRSDDHLTSLTRGGGGVVELMISHDVVIPPVLFLLFGLIIGNVSLNYKCPIRAICVNHLSPTAAKWETRIVTSTDRMSWSFFAFVHCGEPGKL